MPESELQILYSKAKTIDLSRLGGMSGLDSQYKYMETSRIDTILITMVAKALLDGIGGGQTETSLLVRDLRPKDFIDYSGGHNTTYYNWVQHIKPTAKETENGAKGYIAYKMKDLPRIVYIYGVQIPVYSQVGEIEFWRMNEVLMESIDVSDSECKTEFLKTHLMLNRKSHWHKDDRVHGYQINYVLKDGNLINESIVENIKFLGFVCEPIGTSTIPGYNLLFHL